MKIEGKTNYITGEVGVSFSFDSYPELFNALKSLFKKRNEDFLGTEFNDYIDGSLKIVMKDLIQDDSPSQFGWGHSYLNILKDIYPKKTPAVSLDHASLTHTAWNLGCLRVLFEKTANPKIRLNLKDVFERISNLYLEPRYSNEFPGAGGNLTLSQTGLIPAVSLRHTASLIRSYSILAIHPDRIYQGLNLLKSNLHTILKERAFTMSQVLWCFINIPEKIGLKQFKNEIKTLSLALCERFSHELGLWQDEASPSNNSDIYLSLIILSELPELQNSTDMEIQKTYETCFYTLVKNLKYIEDNKVGLPIFTNGNPQVGASIVFLSVIKNLITNDKLIKKELSEKCLNFIISSWDEDENTNHSYPFQYSHIFKLL